MSHHHLKLLIAVFFTALFLAACSSQHVLVKKADLEAADQCLLAQQASHIQFDGQQQQLAEALELLRETMALERRDDAALQELIRKASLERAVGDEQCESQQRSRLQTNAALDKAVVGGTERVLFTDLGIVVQARVDTGATTSSVDVRDIEIFERNGEEWVRFKLRDPELDQMLELERPRLRKARINQPNSDEPDRRPVIELRVTMGNLTQVAEFTLADRSRLEHPVSIGRNVLRDLMIVDVARDNVNEPESPRSPSNGSGEDE